MKVIEIGHVTFRIPCETHTHERNHEFFFILRGNGTYTLGEKSYAVEDNELLYCPSGVPHKSAGKESKKTVEVVYVQCRFSREHPDFKLELTRAFDQGPVPYDPSYLPQLDTIKQMLDSGKPLLREAASHSFTSLVYRIYAGREPFGPGKHQYIEEALRILRKNITGRIGSAALADMLQINPAYFIRLFKRYTGTTPTQYLIRLKLEAAAHFLRHTDRPINLIADELGFCSEFHFSAIFKGHTGMSPSAFRKNSAVTFMIRKAVHAEKS